MWVNSSHIGCRRQYPLLGKERAHRFKFQPEPMLIPPQLRPRLAFIGFLYVRINSRGGTFGACLGSNHPD